jgi:hypothetical protein
MSNNRRNCNNFLGWFWKIWSRGWLSSRKLGLDRQIYDMIKELKMLEKRWRQQCCNSLEKHNFYEQIFSTINCIKSHLRIRIAL